MLFPDRDVRPQFPDLHLDHGRRRLPHRRPGDTASVVGHGDRHGGRLLLNASREKPRFQLLLTGSAIFGSAARSPPSRRLLVFAAALVVTGMAALTITNTSNSLMQLSTEPAMRGRVMALRVAIALGGTPIGADRGMGGDPIRAALGPRHRRGRRPRRRPRRGPLPGAPTLGPRGLRASRPRGALPRTSHAIHEMPRTEWRSTTTSSRARRPEAVASPAPHAEIARPPAPVQTAAEWKAPPRVDRALLATAQGIYCQR